MQSEIPVAPLFVFIYFYTHKVGIRAVINQEDFIRRLQQREKEAFQELFYSWHRPLCFFLTSSMRTPKPIIKQWCDPLMTFHKHC
ncbi:hypothetical protein, partial [Odoribacter splanchnicus]